VSNNSQFSILNFKFSAYCSLFAVCSLLFGCVTSTDFETLRGDVNQTRKEGFEIKKDVSSLKEKTADVIKVDDFNALRESQGEMHGRILEISKDLQLLTGKFDENKYSTEKALKDSASEMNLLKAQITNIEDQVKEVKNRLNTLEGHTGEAKKKVEESKKESPQQQASQSPKPVEPKDKVSLYETAYDSFKDKRYRESREKFEVFMKEYPQDELTDNAQFWIGETYYGEKDFEGAILAYEVVLKKYPKSEKAPGALLKQGFSFIEIGDKKTGKTILEKVVELYPESREAELAKKKIEEIEKGTGKKKK
jgi:tol-pal system protein YbgF